jgi:hypothetical protein
MLDVFHSSPGLDVTLSHTSKDGTVWNSWADASGGGASPVGPARARNALRYTTFRLHNVDRENLDHVIVKYRPFHGVRFRDVALRPGVQTQVRVESLRYEPFNGGEDRKSQKTDSGPASPTRPVEAPGRTHL